MGQSDLEDAEVTPQLGPSVRALRNQRGYSQRELARRAGVDARLLADLERGRHVNPTLRTLLKLQRALGLCSVELLLGGQRRFPSDDLASWDGASRRDGDRTESR